MLKKTALFSFTLIWLSTTAMCIALMIAFGYLPLASQRDIPSLLFGFLSVILMAAAVVMSALITRKFELKFNYWFLIPLGLVLVLYGFSLHVVKVFTVRSMIIGVFMWLSMLTGIILSCLGMHFLVRELEVEEKVCIRLIKRRPIVVLCLIVVAIALYTAVRMLTFNGVFNLDFIELAMPAMCLAASTSFTAKSLLSRRHSLMLMGPQDFLLCSMVMLGLFGLLELLASSLMDFGLKFLSIMLSIITPLFALISVVTMSKIEVEMLSVGRAKVAQSILLEADPLSAWPVEVINNVRKYCKGKSIVLMTRPASILVAQVKSDVLVFTDPSATYPQQVSGGIYKIPPETSHILNFISKVREESSKPLCLVFDSLTDVIATLGVREGYRIARDILAILSADDVAIFIIFPKAHSESEVSLMRTLFTHRLEVV